MGMFAVSTPVLPENPVRGLELVRRGMAGCGSCLRGERGMGLWEGSGEGTGEGGGGSTAGAGGGWDWARDLTRGVTSIVSAVVTPPTYRSTSPGGTVEIRTGGTGINYPGTGPASAAAIGAAAGMSSTTLLLIGAGLVALIMAARQR